MSYTDMKTKYPMEVIVLRHHFDHITPKKIQQFREYDADPENASFYLLLIKRIEIEMISDVKNSLKLKLYKYEHSISYNFSYSNINYHSTCLNKLSCF